MLPLYWRLGFFASLSHMSDAELATHLRDQYNRNPAGIELMPVKLGSSTKPMPGWDVRVLGTDGHEAKRGEIGALAVKLPLPPGALPTLWQADDRFKQSYLEEYPGYYQTADAGYVDEDGYVYVMTRTDDIINVAGHRLSTGGIEEVLAAHPDVAECAVIGVHDSLKGQVPLGFLVLKAGVKKARTEVAAEAVLLVRERIGPVASFKTALVVERLPKTRSGSSAWRLTASMATNTASRAAPPPRVTTVVWSPHPWTAARERP